VREYGNVCVYMQLYLEMGRIAQNKRLRLVVCDAWAKIWVKRILNQAGKEKATNTRLREAMNILMLPDSNRKLSIISESLLTYTYVELTHS
jgi:hypothetical protein